MKRIVCPIDFSEASNSAVEYAANLVKHLDAELILLHVIHEYKFKTTASVSSVLPVEARIKTARERLAEYQKMVKDEFDISCSLEVKANTSSVSTALRKEIEGEGYDLIVMGTNGADDLKQFLFGSHTYNVIRKISKPLLLVPDGYAYSDPRKVVYASDYNKEDVHVLSNVLNLTEGFGSEVTLLHFSEYPTQSSEDIFLQFEDIYKDYLKNDKIKFERIVSKEEAQGIDHYMHKNNADLLTLTTHKYSFFEKLFHESITRKLAFIANYPILIYQTGRTA